MKKLKSVLDKAGLPKKQSNEDTAINKIANNLFNTRRGLYSTFRL